MNSVLGHGTGSIMNNLFDDAHNKAMKSDRHANELLRDTSAIKLSRTSVPLRLPLIAKPL